jgi:DNA-binding response OmpR family regulator
LTRIALVYKDPMTRNVLAFWLRYAGYDVALCRYDEAACTLAERIRPDLVLIDYDLPEGHGPKVLAELRAAHALRGVPILVLAATGAPGGPDERALADGWLTKPCDVGALSVWLVRLLGSPLRSHLS